MNIFIKKFRILGRSKKLVIFGDIIFLLILAIILNYYVVYSISKIKITQTILESISKTKIDKKESAPVITAPIEKKCSEIKINYYAYYNNLNGDQLGIGPIPPIVDIPTSYWVFVEVENKDKIKDLNIITEIPNYTHISQNRSSNSGEFQLLKNGISWTIYKSENQKHKFGFEVFIKPNQSHVGKVLDITSKIKYSYYNITCEKQITGELGALDTNLKYDKINFQKGIVQK